MVVAEAGACRAALGRELETAGDDEFDEGFDKAISSRALSSARPEGSLAERAAGATASDDLLALTAPDSAVVMKDKPPSLETSSKQFEGSLSGEASAEAWRRTSVPSGETDRKRSGLDALLITTLPEAPPSLTLQTFQSNVTSFLPPLAALTSSGQCAASELRDWAGSGISTFGRAKR
mmetsp:Transcript_145964/g.466514  ORF Transcript_145964/g.466514 Transcript_145964/m.466514 type:complete len:178 (+) Transcript_145964:1187-1720(+)